jgi:hypothetical protein
MKKNSSKFLYILLIIFIIGISIFIFIKVKGKSDKYTIPKSLKSSLIQKHSFKPVNSFNKFTLSQNKLKENLTNFQKCLNTIPNFYSYLGFLGKGYNLYKESIDNIKIIGKSTLDIDYRNYNVSNIIVDMPGENTTVNTLYYGKDTSITASFRDSISTSASYKGAVSAKVDASLIIGKEYTSETKYSSMKIYNSNTYGSARIPTDRYADLTNMNMLEDIKLISDMIAKTQDGIIDDIYYKLFISKYGSHFITQINFGSSFNYWLTVTSSKTSDEETLQVAMKLQGGYAGIQSSANTTLSTDEKKTVAESNLIKVVDVRGGSPYSRGELISSSTITGEIIDRFVRSASKYPSKTSFIFYPVWDLIRNMIIPTDSCSLTGLNNSDLTKIPCPYNTFAQKLENYYDNLSNADSNILPTNDNFLVSQFNNKCIALNSSTNNELYLEPCENSYSQKFHGNTYQNIMIGGTDNCLQSQSDATFGSKIIASNSDCGVDQKFAKMWEYDGENNSIKWRADDSMCLENIIDFKYDKSSNKTTFGPYNDKLTLNRCNGSSMQKWNFTNDVSTTLPPLPNNNDIPTPSDKYCKFWDIRTKSPDGNTITTYNLYLSPDNKYYLNYYPCSSDFFIQGGPVKPSNGYYQWILDDGVKTPPDILKLDYDGIMYMNDIELTSNYSGWGQRDNGVIFLYKNFGIGMDYNILFSGNNIIWGINAWNNENPGLINTPITPTHYPGRPIRPYNGYYQWTLNDGVKTSPDILKLDSDDIMYMNDIELTSGFSGWKQQDDGMLFLYKNFGIGMDYNILFSGNNIIWGINAWNSEHPGLINTPITPTHYPNNNLSLLVRGIPGVDNLHIQFQYDKVIGGNIGYNNIITKPVAKLAQPIEKPVFGCNMWVVKTNDTQNNYSLIQWNDDEDRNVWKIDTVEITASNIYIAPLSVYTDNYRNNIQFGINQSIIGGTFNGKQIIQGGGNMLFQNLYKNNQKPYIDNTETFTYTLEAYKDGRNLNKYLIKYTSSSIQIKNVTLNDSYQTIDPDWNGNILKFQLTSNGVPYRSGYIVFGNDMGPDKIFFASIIEIGRSTSGNREYTYRDIRPDVSFLSANI